MSASLAGVNGRRQGPESPWLSVSGAARALGVSASTLRHWASEGRVPHVRTAGGHRRFDPDELRRWLARQPPRSARSLRPRTPAVTAAPQVATALRRRSGLATELLESLLEGQAEAAYLRLPPEERPGVVEAWVDALAAGFESGNLRDALERAEAYGRGHGLAGSSAEVTLGGSLALERALRQALASPPPILDERERALLAEAVGELTVRVASGWATAVAARARSSGVSRGGREPES